MSPKKYRRLLHFNKVISQNRNTLVAGYTMTKQQFISLFNLPQVPTTGNYKTLHAANLKLMSYGREINQLMQENGLKFSSEDYYDYFKIQTCPDTKELTKKFNNNVDRQSDAIERINAGVVRRQAINQWGRLRSLTPYVIAGLDTYPQTSRGQQMSIRVQSW